MLVFFFKQKTAYEMLRSLVGSEMCIRDRCEGGERDPQLSEELAEHGQPFDGLQGVERDHAEACLLYTSDAADDLLCVDLGGRRIIKKNKNKHLQSVNLTPTSIARLTAPPHASYHLHTHTSPS